MILWFSGTGNSRFVAESLSSQLGQKPLELRPSVTSAPVALDNDDRTVIWVCPVYSWGIPPYIRTVIRNIQFKAPDKHADAVVHHLVLTCGDDCGLAPEMWRKEISSRGWKDGNAYSVTMPNNYVCMSGFDVDPKDVEQQKLNSAPVRIAEIAAGIKSATDDRKCHTDVIRGRFAWIKTKIIYPWFARNAMSPKPFHYTSDCISCGRCSAVCPMRNIEMRPDAMSDRSGRTRKHPLWGDNCAGCLACYHICPRHAVMYGKATRNKGQYFNPNVRTL